MILSNANVGKIIYIVVAVLVVSAGIFFAIYIPTMKKKQKSEFKYFYYKSIYKVAMDNDYYLINNFLFKIDDSYVGRIDHILFANKYIYIINDSYFDGDIDGKENDKSIILINRAGKKNYSDNPLLANQKLLKRLSIITGIDATLMIGVCLINNDCQCGVRTSSKSAYIVQAKKFKALVKAIESRDIGDINKEQLANAVKAIDKLNRRNRNSGKK